MFPLPSIPRPSKAQRGLQEPLQKLLGPDSRQVEALPPGITLHLLPQLWYSFTGSKHSQRVVWGGWKQRVVLKQVGEGGS